MLNVSNNFGPVQLEHEIIKMLFQNSPILAKF